MKSTEEKRRFLSTSNRLLTFRAVASWAILWHIDSIRYSDNRDAESKALNVSGFRLTRRVMTARLPQVPALIQPPGNALLEALVVETPRFKHAASAHDSGNAALRRKRREPVVMR
jgi:hypothetical protein